MAGGDHRSIRRRNAGRRDAGAPGERGWHEPLERVEREPFIAGMFWWKWLPGSRERGDFSMRHPEARQILRAAWGDQAGAGHHSSR